VLTRSGQRTGRKKVARVSRFMATVQVFLGTGPDGRRYVLRKHRGCSGGLHGG
jgi:hypothetical protein